MNIYRIAFTGVTPWASRSANRTDAGRAIISKPDPPVHLGGITFGGKDMNCHVAEGGKLYRRAKRRAKGVTARAGETTESAALIYISAVFPLTSMLLFASLAASFVSHPVGPV